MILGPSLGSVTLGGYLGEISTPVPINPPFTQGEEQIDEAFDVDIDGTFIAREIGGKTSLVFWSSINVDPRRFAVDLVLKYFAKKYNPQPSLAAVTPFTTHVYDLNEVPFQSSLVLAGGDNKQVFLNQTTATISPVSIVFPVLVQLKDGQQIVVVGNGPFSQMDFAIDFSGVAYEGLPLTAPIGFMGFSFTFMFSVIGGYARWHLVGLSN